MNWPKTRGVSHFPGSHRVHRNHGNQSTIFYLYGCQPKNRGGVYPPKWIPILVQHPYDFRCCCLSPVMEWSYVYHVSWILWGVSFNAIGLVSCLEIENQGSSWDVPRSPRTPSWEIPQYKPYSSWVYMGKLSPRIPRLNTINTMGTLLGVHLIVPWEKPPLNIPTITKTWPLEPPSPYWCIWMWDAQAHELQL